MSDQRRVCLLTGSSGLLGTAFCRRLASRYQIVAVWRTNPPAVATQDQRFVDPLDPTSELHENDHRVLAMRADLLSAPQTERLVERVLRRFGRVDLIVNAAAHRQWGALVDDTDLRRNIDRHFSTNVRAPLCLTVEVARQFWQGRAADNHAANRNVINLSSTAGLRVYPGYGQSLYSASKAALDFVSCHLASELAPHSVRVNALAPNTFPGIVRTEAVLDSMVRLDDGAMTGKVLMLDANTERWYDLVNDWEDEPRSRASG